MRRRLSIAQDLTVVGFDLNCTMWDVKTLVHIGILRPMGFQDPCMHRCSGFDLTRVAPNGILRPFALALMRQSSAARFEDLTLCSRI